MPGESTEYAYDVFVSYSPADEAWVTDTLLPKLKAAKLKASTTWNFQPGAPEVDEMERLVRASRKTLVILTPAYTQSNWAKLADSMVQTLDPAGDQHLLIPVFKAPCEAPLRIQRLSSVDMTQAGELELAWRQLLTALGAPPPQEAPATATRESWYLPHPYPMPPNFTGRAAERGMLSDWLERDGEHPLLVLRALGGFGKSALVWQWLLHDVGPARWPRAVWWSFYEGDASFDSFLASTLPYLSADPHGLGPRQQAEALLSLLHLRGLLLVLDGFERALRAFSSINAAYQGDEAEEAVSQQPSAFSHQPSAISPSSAPGGHPHDCVSPVAEYFLRAVCCLPGIQGKVLMTTRLRPRAVEERGGELLAGCREEELSALRPEDAAAFFRGQGVRGGRAELEALGEPYGYHPLSLRLLAGLIARDPRQPGDASAAPHIDVSDDLVQRQHHVLEQAYEQLSPGSQLWLGRIACFRGPVRYEALEALAKVEEPEKPRKRGRPPANSDRARKPCQGSETAELDAALLDLVARGLLHRDLKTQ